MNLFMRAETIKKANDIRTMRIKAGRFGRTNATRLRKAAHRGRLHIFVKGEVSRQMRIALHDRLPGENLSFTYSPFDHRTKIALNSFNIIIPPVESVFG